MVDIKYRQTIIVKYFEVTVKYVKENNQNTHR